MFQLHPGTGSPGSCQTSGLITYVPGVRMKARSNPDCGAKLFLIENKGLPRSQTTKVYVFRFESTLGQCQAGLGLKGLNQLPETRLRQRLETHEPGMSLPTRFNASQEASIVLRWCVRRAYWRGEVR